MYDYQTLMGYFSRDGENDPKQGLLDLKKKVLISFLGIDLTLENTRSEEELTGLLLKLNILPSPKDSEKFIRSLCYHSEKGICFDYDYSDLTANTSALIFNHESEKRYTISKITYNAYSDAISRNAMPLLHQK